MFSSQNIVKKSICVCDFKAGTAIALCGSCGGARVANSMDTLWFLGGVVQAMETMVKGLPWWRRLFNTFSIQATVGRDGGVIIKIN